MKGFRQRMRYNAEKCLEFDEQLSPYRAQRILDFFIKALGPPLYNQAISDARAFMSHKLDDLDAEFYQPEDKE